MQTQHLIIVAGGTGSRMGSDIPKQFLKIGQVPVIIKTIRCFLQYNPDMHIIICVHKDYVAHMQTLLQDAKLGAGIIITPGGATRFHSVKNGLAFLNNSDGIVAIHDAARPFVSLQTIKNCFETAMATGNAVPAVDVTDSLRKTGANSNMAVNRSEYRIIQTPQCFKITEIQNAFAREYNSAFTDDATVLEAAGAKINLVNGNIENIKITTPQDLIIAKYFMENEQR